jgi:flavin reductase (DIM6/NTAB) family NADH-FMN oxidoreductase RutF
MSSDLFLAGMRKVAGAVSVITTSGNDGERRGLTATAVCSLSAAPPSLIACVNRKTWVAQFVPDSGVFAVNVLSHAQETIARTFAGQTGLAADARFSVGEWQTRRTGVPIVSGALAAFECRLERIVEHTTHIVLIGEVVETVLGDGHSLVYLDGGFSQVIRPLSAA